MVATISEIVNLRAENGRLRMALEEALTQVQMHQAAAAATAAALNAAAAQAMHDQQQQQHAAVTSPEMSTPPGLTTTSVMTPPLAEATSRVQAQRPPPLAADYGAQAADDAAAALSALKRSCGPVAEESAERKRSKWSSGEWGSSIISPPAYNGGNLREETPTSNEPAEGLPNRRLSSSSTTFASTSASTTGKSRTNSSSSSSSGINSGSGSGSGSAKVRGRSVSSTSDSSVDALVDGSDAWKHTRGRKNSLIWTEPQDALLIEAVKQHKGKNWKAVAEMVGLERTNIQCKHRWQKVLDPNLVKGPWSPEEDHEIVGLVTEHGAKRWSFIAKHLHGRTGKQCRERWVNQLDPTIKKDPWSAEEDSILQDAHQRLGNKWAEIAKLLVGRSENAVKNRWHGSLRRNMVYLANKAASAAVKAAAVKAGAPEGKPAVPATSMAAAAAAAAASGDSSKADVAGYWLFCKGGAGEKQAVVQTSPELSGIKIHEP